MGLNHYLHHLTNPNWLVTGLSSPWLVTGMTRKKGYLPTRVIYPLVNIQKTMENHHAAINGKTNISMAMASMSQTVDVYQAGYHQMVG